MTNNYQNPRTLTPEKAARAMLFGNGLIGEIQELYFPLVSQTSSQSTSQSRLQRQMPIPSQSRTQLGFTRLNVERVEEIK